jgi:hypothetical protein
MLCTLFSCFIPTPTQQFTFSSIVRCQVASGANLNFKGISVYGGISYDSNIVYNTSNLYDDRSLLTLRVQFESYSNRNNLQEIRSDSHSAETGTRDHLNNRDTRSQ